MLTPLQLQLFELQDKKYREFHQRLVPTLPPEKIIGIRTPVLRRFAREFAKNESANEFVSALPHEYYEENNLHAFLIETYSDFDRALAAVDAFLPYVDNWATCDSLRPRAFRKNPTRLLPSIHRWILSENTFTVRYAIELLMTHFLDRLYSHEYAKLVASVLSDEYYVNMMIAWYFATALAKQYDDILPFIIQHRLPDWVHNKTIQKAVESYRISDEQKRLLKTLRL